jgi:DNA-binding NtrC family response regulator
VGTLIVRDVARLTKDRQRRLFEWLNQRSRPVRVIATSTKPFFRQVERKMFLDDLYYRLNTITVLLDRPLDTRRLVA